MTTRTLTWGLLVFALFWLAPSSGLSGPCGEFCPDDCPCLCYCCAASIVPPQGASSLRLPLVADQPIPARRHHHPESGHLDSIYRPPRAA
jgi:hypothetical protein